MAKDLTTSAIDRQNILNNPFAIKTIHDNLDVKFVNFKGTLVTTKQKVAEYYEIDPRTIELCLKANVDELRNNGYRVLEGEVLKEFKKLYQTEIDFGQKTKALGIFDFRSFLNLGMLLTEHRGVSPHQHHTYIQVIQVSQVNTLYAILGEEHQN